MSPKHLFLVILHVLKSVVKMDNKHNIVKEIDESRQGEAILVDGLNANNKKIYIESYGCQMNFSDSEIVASIMKENGYNTTQSIEEADVLFVNTCSVRDKAEQTVRKRLSYYQHLKNKNPKVKVGVLGCMAERVKEDLLEEEKVVDLIVGPDAYRDLPSLLNDVDDGRNAVNVILSKEETYGDIAPVRLGGNGVSAFVSITRGCDNMCTFCVVPFTRGRERSRDPQSILQEIKDLYTEGYREVTLLGQNVDSYLWYGGGAKKDFEKASEMAKATAVDFAQLLDQVATVVPNMRIRFATSNPQDMSEEVLHVIAKHENICKYIHLPVQSGSSRLLKHMNRGHNREEYMELIERIRKIVPDCAISMDMISGYPTETEQDHKDTLDLMKFVRYSYGYMFKYSERPGTLAARKYEDDVDEADKARRLSEVIELQGKHSLERMQEFVGKEVEVLVEGISKRSKSQLHGRNSQNAVVIFDKQDFKPGDFVMVRITDCTSATLFGTPIAKVEK